MSDLNLPGAEDDGIMGEEPLPEGAREQAEDAGSELQEDDGGGVGLGRTPMPPD